MTSVVHLIRLGQDVTSPELANDNDAICAPFVFKLVHSTAIVKDPSSKIVTHYRESDDYICLTEVTKERKVKEKGKKDQITKVQDSREVRFNPCLTWCPTRISSRKLKEAETEILGVLYTSDLTTSAKARFLQVCVEMKMQRSKYNADRWINHCLRLADKANIFKHAHETNILKVNARIPTPDQKILDPTQGWLYDSTRRDHILCCPQSGRPVFDTRGNFSWALSFRPKPTKTVSLPEKTPKRQEEKPAKKQPKVSGATSMSRPVAGTHRSSTMK